MKTRLFIAAITMLAAFQALAEETLPLKSVNLAGEVIDAAVEAHGGAEALAELNSLAIKTEFVNYAVGQSREPGPPYDKNSQKTMNAIDLQNEIFVNRSAGAGGGFEFDGGPVINGENSWQIDYRGNTAAPIAEPDFHTQSGPFIRVTPALLIKQLQARRGQSNWLGVAEIDGRKHDVITLVMEVGPALGLYFDQETHMLTRMERVLPPFGQVEYRFNDYKTIDGIPFNHDFELFVNGQQNLEITVTDLKINPSMESYTQVPANIRKVAAITPNPMSSQEIKEGVFLVGGNGSYAMFVEMDEYVVAIGGTQGVGAAITEIRKEIADKPIRYGVLTHHHNDHVPGSAAYASNGATIVTFKENETVVRNAAGDADVSFEFVEDRMTLSDGSRVVELINIGPTPHVENMLIAYLPEEGIIFEADHFPQPSNGNIAPAVSTTHAFAAALDRLDLDYQIIVGAHSPRVGSKEDLQAALSRQPTAP